MTAEAFLTAISVLADLHPDAQPVEAADGTLADNAFLLVSGPQMSSMNGVFVRGPADATEIDRLAGRAAGAGLPWSIVVRGKPGADVAAVAERHGRTGCHEMPLMECPAGEVRLRGPRSCGDVEVRVIASDEQKIFVDTLAAGEGAPTEIIGSLMIEPMIDAAWAGAYLVEVAGVPVATGLSVRTGDHIGVYGIATVPEARRRGYGRLVTERVLADAFTAGATTAYLQSSEMGKPLYESMGFQTVETWTYLT